jgi:hypothetical protein
MDWTLMVETLSDLASGVPVYDFANPVRFDVPFTNSNLDPNTGQPIDIGQVNRIKYLADTDTMFIAGDGDAWMPNKVYRYDNFIKNSLPPSTTTPANAMQPTVVIDLGRSINASGTHLDVNSAAQTTPIAFTADKDYVYVGYLGEGKDARQRGEVIVYSATDGHEVG